MTLNEVIRPFFKGNEWAVRLIDDLFAVWHIWDDLIDKDKPVSDEQINQAFILAFVNIPRNVFYQTHFSILNPIMENVIINWLASVKLENGNNQLDIAFDLRNSYVNMVTACANIIGGPEWAAQVSIAAHQALRKVETYETYVQSIQMQNEGQS